MSEPNSSCWVNCILHDNFKTCFKSAFVFRAFPIYSFFNDKNVKMLCFKKTFSENNARLGIQPLFRDEPTFSPESLSAGEHGLIPEKRLDTEPRIMLETAQSGFHMEQQEKTLYKSVKQYCFVSFISIEYSWIEQIHIQSLEIYRARSKPCI